MKTKKGKEENQLHVVKSTKGGRNKAGILEKIKIQAQMALPAKSSL